jgi:hypothetical protein
MAAVRFVSFLVALSFIRVSRCSSLAFSPTRHVIQAGFKGKSGLSPQPPFLMRPRISNRLSVVSMASNLNEEEARNALSRRHLLTALGFLSVSSGFADRAHGIVSPLQVFISTHINAAKFCDPSSKKRLGHALNLGAKKAAKHAKYIPY